MNRKKLLVIGKILINSGVLCLLPLPLLSYEEYKTHIALVALVIIFIGCILCVVTNKTMPEEKTLDNNPFRHSLIVLYFKTIKWALIVAIIFHIIAACIILFFYWLKRELEATLLITVLLGIAIGLICEVAIPYYKNYKDKKTN